MGLLRSTKGDSLPLLGVGESRDATGDPFAVGEATEAPSVYHSVQERGGFSFRGVDGGSASGPLTHDERLEEGLGGVRGVMKQQLKSP